MKLALMTAALLGFCFPPSYAHSLRPVNEEGSEDLEAPELNGDVLLDSVTTPRYAETNIQDFIHGSQSFIWPEMQDLLSILNDHHSFLIHSGIGMPAQQVDRQDGPFEPIRFKIDYSPLERRASVSQANAVRVQTIKDVTMPRVISTWVDALYVQRLKEPLEFRTRIGGVTGTCFGTPFSQPIVNDTDYLLIVDGRNDNEYPCSLGSIAAFAGPCVFDNLPFNPRAGRLTVCLDRIPIRNGEVLQTDIDSQVFIQMHEIGHVLGIGAEFFQFFNDESGSPYGVQRGHFPCVNEEDGFLQYIPANVQAGSYGDGDREHSFYELMTPRVTRIVQNMFACPLITGARLENQPTSEGDTGKCIGVHLDERLFYDDVLGAIANDVIVQNNLSPVALAILEDSGWYRVDYSKSIPRSFGLGAGCDFVTKECLNSSDGSVPTFAKGIFCNDRDSSFDRCDPSHNARAFCASFNFDVPEEYRYFPDSARLGGLPVQLDYCPIAINSAAPCGSGQKCFEREQDNSICLDTTCDADLSQVEFRFQGQIYGCREDHEVINIVGLGDVICPRFAATCPHLTCPSLCSGRGTCDWSSGSPHCVCDNPEDDTIGCTSFLGISANTIQLPSPSETPSVLESSPPTTSPTILEDLPQPSEIPSPFGSSQPTNNGASSIAPVSSPSQEPSISTQSLPSGLPNPLPSTQQRSSQPPSHPSMDDVEEVIDDTPQDCGDPKKTGGKKRKRDKKKKDKTTDCEQHNAVGEENYGHEDISDDQKRDETEEGEKVTTKGKGKRGKKGKNDTKARRLRVSRAD